MFKQSSAGPLPTEPANANTEDDGHALFGGSSDVSLAETGRPPSSPGLGGFAAQPGESTSTQLPLASLGPEAATAHASVVASIAPVFVGAPAGVLHDDSVPAPGPPPSAAESIERLRSAAGLERPTSASNQFRQTLAPKGMTLHGVLPPVALGSAAMDEPSLLELSSGAADDVDETEISLGSVSQRPRSDSMQPSMASLPATRLTPPASTIQLDEGAVALDRASLEPRVRSLTIQLDEAAVALNRSSLQPHAGTSSDERSIALSPSSVGPRDWSLPPLSAHQMAARPSPLSIPGLSPANDNESFASVRQLFASAAPPASNTNSQASGRPAASVAPPAPTPQPIASGFAPASILARTLAGVAIPGVVPVPSITPVSPDASRSALPPADAGSGATSPGVASPIVPLVAGVARASMPAALPAAEEPSLVDVASLIASVAGRSLPPLAAMRSRMPPTASRSPAPLVSTPPDAADVPGISQRAVAALGIAGTEPPAAVSAPFVSAAPASTQSVPPAAASAWSLSAQTDAAEVAGSDSQLSAASAAALEVLDSLADELGASEAPDGSDSLSPGSSKEKRAEARRNARRKSAKSLPPPKSIVPRGRFGAAEIGVAGLTTMVALMAAAVLGDRAGLWSLPPSAAAFGSLSRAQPESEVSAALAKQAHVDSTKQAAAPHREPDEEEGEEEAHEEVVLFAPQAQPAAEAAEHAEAKHDATAQPAEAAEVRAVRPAMSAPAEAQRERSAASREERAVAAREVVEARIERSLARQGYAAASVAPSRPTVQTRPAAASPQPSAARSVAPNDDAETESSGSVGLLRSARAKLRANDAEAAEPLLRRALQQDPDDHHVKEELIRALIKLGQGHTAVQYAEQIVRKRPRRVAYRVLEGDVKRLAGDEDGAQAAWRWALGIDPDNAEAQKRLGM